MNTIHTLLIQARPNGQDRIKHTQLTTQNGEELTLLFLADGAGGSAAGDRAAELFLKLSESELSRAKDPQDLLTLERTLRDLDRAFGGMSDIGETTAVIVVVSSTQVTGVSVGDSECWGFSEDLGFEWSGQQYRKPLLGTGKATPVAFGPFAPTGRILIASDGLFDYIKHDALKACIENPNPDDVLEGLHEAVKLPNGELRDDLAMILFNFTTQ